jgi:hypothetical protein
MFYCTPSHVSNHDLYIVNVVTYILTSPEARLFWTSLNHQSTDSELAHLWQVARAVAAGSGARDRVYHAVQAYPWQPAVAAILNLLVEETRKKALNTLSDAYPSVTLDMATTHLGLSASDAQACK